MCRGRPVAGPLPAALAAALLVIAGPRPTLAQGASEYRLALPNGAELTVGRDSLLRLLEQTRARVRELEEDPRVLYYTGVGPAVPAVRADPSYPWNAVQVLTDSTATVETPGNLREGDRAYQAYAVERMRNVRSDPDVSCDSLMARESAAVGAFLDGWLVSRALFGAPPYPPLDELPLARAAGHLPALLAAFGDRQLGGCLTGWREANVPAVEAYLAWRREAFPGAPPPPEASVPASEAAAPSEAAPAGEPPTRGRDEGRGTRGWRSGSTTR